MSNKHVHCDYYRVVYRKRQFKKHKTWDDDGYLTSAGGQTTLLDGEGKEIASGKSKVSAEKEFSLGHYDLEITDIIAKEDLKFDKTITQSDHAIVLKPFSFKSLGNREKSGVLIKDTKPRHDPTAHDALVLTKIPNLSVQRAVVVDPLLSKVLRDHQKLGVCFLYECVMGIRGDARKGAILADEMGLGKSIQTIALIWTLLILIICPASLVSNWTKEFKKWLGKDRLKVFPVDQKTNVKHFTVGVMYSVMIIGYEKFRSCSEDLISAKFDLVICDEGHRLKNSKVRITKAINSMSCVRRIILTGTPIQNDLEEFFTMLDMVNPGFIGSFSDFKRLYDNPISRGTDPDASSFEKTLGQERLEELIRITSGFVLRRTAATISDFLPPKIEILLFIKPNPLQISLYKQVLDSGAVSRMLESHEITCNFPDTLSSIMTLRKISNSPELVLNNENSSNDFVVNFKNDQLRLSKPGSKINALALFLKHFKAIQEKVVIVSSFTQTLDLIQILCEENQYSFKRLDGKTGVQLRSKIVDDFNNDENIFAFLLSTKAGGTGLNLIGASELILVDVDWNPSTDAQAMARIWRKGQKKTVHIYRFLLTGTIDERIYQRQISKLGMNGSIFEDITQESKISVQDLKDIFSFDEKTDCLTHQLSECACLTGKEKKDDWMHLPLNGDTNSYNQWSEIDEGLDQEFYRWISELASFAYVRSV